MPNVLPTMFLLSTFNGKRLKITHTVIEQITNYTFKLIYEYKTMNLKYNSILIN